MGKILQVPVQELIIVLPLSGGTARLLKPHEPSLLANAISTRISCAGPLVLVAWIPYFVLWEKRRLWWDCKNA